MTFPSSRSLSTVLPLLAGVAIVVAGCESPVDSGPTALDELPVFEGRVNGEVEIPFKASFYTDLAGLAPDPSCGAPPVFQNTQVGEGEFTHMGRATVSIVFCVDATDLLDDGTLTGDESAPYFNGVGVIVAANGDELWLEIPSGAVLPSDDPDWDFMFQDPFLFTGGTGRFEGASGGGTTDSVVDQAANRTFHDWEGVLRVVR